jgi:hypothetical protein
MKILIASVSPATADPELTLQLDDGKQEIAMAAHDGEALAGSSAIVDGSAALSDPVPRVILTGAG